MSSIAWSEAFSVGNPLLDSDHRILIDLLVQLYDATDTGQSRDVVGSVINVLVEYVEHHFHREEALMTQIGYPEREMHIQSHRDLENRVREARRRWMGGERQVLDDDLMVFLKRWLTDHILGADIAYRPWVEAAAGTHGDAD